MLLGKRDQPSRSNRARTHREKAEIRLGRRAEIGRCLCPRQQIVLASWPSRGQGSAVTFGGIRTSPRNNGGIFMLTLVTLFCRRLLVFDRPTDHSTRDSAHGRQPQLDGRELRQFASRSSMVLTRTRGWLPQICAILLHDTCVARIASRMHQGKSGPRQLARLMQGHRGRKQVVQPDLLQFCADNCVHRSRCHESRRQRDLCIAPESLVGGNLLLLAAPAWYSESTPRAPCLPPPRSSMKAASKALRFSRYSPVSRRPGDHSNKDV